MILKEIINKSYYGTINYVSDRESLDVLERYINYNLEVLKEYKGIIVATNYSDLKLKVKNTQIWQKYFPECIIIDLPKNRGDAFGTADLDTAVFNYCKDNNIEWLCKTSGDIILQKQLLEIPINEADFYYLEGIGRGGLANYNSDIDKIIKEYFFPQTNFYIINVSKTDYLNDTEYINKTYNECQKIPKKVWKEIFLEKPWGPFPGWACEQFLADCVVRNNLKKYHLLSKERYIVLMDIIEKCHIDDCSHKNIMIDGICHFHNINDDILILK